MTSLVPPHGGLTEPVSPDRGGRSHRRLSRPCQNPAASARLRRRPVDRLSAGRRRPEPADRPDGLGDLRPRARRVGHRAQGQALRLDHPVGLAGHRGAGQAASAGPEGGAGEFGRRDRRRANITDVYPWDKKKYLEQRVSDRADRPSRRRHGAEGRRRQDASAGRHDRGPAAAERTRDSASTC